MAEFSIWYLINETHLFNFLFFLGGLAGFGAMVALIILFQIVFYKVKLIFFFIFLNQNISGQTQQERI